MLPPAAIAALWALYDATGVRPEYVIPVLSFESGLDPSVGNRAGAAYYGVNQTSADWLRAHGIEPSDFVTWTVEEQIRAAVLPQMAAHVRDFGPLRSATRVYQANFLPATLGRRSLTQIVTVRGTAWYNANRILDPFGHGAILVSDLAAVMARESRKPSVQAMIQDAYAERPEEQPRNPVYGEDFVDPRAWLLAPAAALAYAVHR